MINFDFDQEALKNAAIEFEKIEKAPEQQTIIDGIARILVKYIPISELSIKGFISFAFRDYQTAEQKKISEIALMNPEGRINAVETLFNLFSKKIQTILKNERSREQLRKGVQRAFNYYKKNFAYR